MVASPVRGSCTSTALVSARVGKQARIECCREIVGTSMAEFNPALLVRILHHSETHQQGPLHACMDVALYLGSGAPRLLDGGQQYSCHPSKYSWCILTFVL